MGKGYFVNSSGLAKAYIQLGHMKKGSGLATMRALNRTVDYTATLTKREVTQVYSVNPEAVKKTLTKHKASKSSLTASVKSTGRRISLGDFPHTPAKYNNKAKVVKVKIRKKEGYKPIRTSPKAFVQTIYGDKPDIYIRKGERINRPKGASDLPVRMLRSLAVPQMVANDEVMNRIKPLSDEMFEKRLVHELNRELEKAAKKK